VYSVSYVISDAEKGNGRGPAKQDPLALSAFPFLFHEEFEVTSGLTAVELVAAKYHGRKRSLIPILQDLQERCQWLSPRILDEVAIVLGLPAAHVWSVATFYRSFSLEPRGRHRCTVCMGTACHVRGGAAVLEHFERKLGIHAGETSADGEYTLERVNCLGACALAPLAIVDGRYYGQMNETKANAVLQVIRKPKEPERKSDHKAPA
jgi:NADH-quinone oxidoreductase subunit E